MQKIFKYLIFFLLLIMNMACKKSGIRISENFTFIQGDVNSAVISSGDKKLIVYGVTKGGMENVDMVLYTHANRDVSWAGEKLVRNGAKAIVPHAELVYFTKTDSIWKNFPEAQFHDYSLNTVRIPAESINAHRSVKEGDIVNWNNIEITVVDSRGYSPGAVSYLAQIDRLKVAFVGDLIYGDGKIFDLYSLQDKIPELDVMAYHGFAARISEQINSLNKILEFEPDILVPAHGPLIRTPKSSVNKQIIRLQSIYSNFLSTSAYKWHRSQNWIYNPNILNDLYNRVSKEQLVLQSMPRAELGQNPEWLKHIGTSRLIISKDKSGFLIDCGDINALNTLLELGKKFTCNSIEGIFITHYHDDHVDYISELQTKYKCPVYVTKQLEDILKKPEGYKMPALSANQIKDITVVENNSSINWKEFVFSFYDFPGQTLYHNAMLAEQKGRERIFFIGDSFSPSGLDDYCLQNRNFIKDGEGYFRCLDFFQELPNDYWLVNNHVEVPFRFNAEEIEFMNKQLRERQKLLADLFPWDDLNFGIDANWARIYPYQQTIKAGEPVEFSVVITNHSRQEQKFKIKPKNGILNFSPESQIISIESGKEGWVKFKLENPHREILKDRVITSDITFNGKTLHRWCESVLLFER